jgi:hypothetical protein
MNKITKDHTNRLETRDMNFRSTGLEIKPAGFHIDMACFHVFELIIWMFESFAGDARSRSNFAGDQGFIFKKTFKPFRNFCTELRGVNHLWP